MKPRPLDPAAVERALDGISPRVVVLRTIGSTNDEGRALARDGAPHLSVVVAEAQTAGRGRLGRTWAAEPGESLLASWVVRPALPVERWPLMPLLAGLAIAEAVERRARVATALKWPNDVLAAGRKLAGVLVEADPPAYAVVGAGVNVSQTVFAPPLDGIATSIAVEGGVRLDRVDMLAWILRLFDEALGDPDAGLERYRERCATIGSGVRVERAGRETLTGRAVAVDDDGALVVETAAGTERLASGDVVHLRPS